MWNTYCALVVIQVSIRNWFLPSVKCTGSLYNAIITNRHVTGALATPQWLYGSRRVFRKRCHAWATINRDIGRLSNISSNKREIWDRNSDTIFGIDSDVIVSRRLLNTCLCGYLSIHARGSSMMTQVKIRIIILYCNPGHAFWWCLYSLYICINNDINNELNLISNSMYMICINNDININLISNGIRKNYFFLYFAIISWYDLY